MKKMFFEELHEEFHEELHEENVIDDHYVEHLKELNEENNFAAEVNKEYQDEGLQYRRTIK